MSGPKQKKAAKAKSPPVHQTEEELQASLVELQWALRAHQRKSMFFALRRSPLTPHAECLTIKAAEDAAAAEDEAAFQAEQYELAANPDADEEAEQHKLAANPDADEEALAAGADEESEEEELDDTEVGRSNVLKRRRAGTQTPVILCSTVILTLY